LARKVFDLILEWHGKLQTNSISRSLGGTYVRFCTSVSAALLGPLFILLGAGRIGGMLIRIFVGALYPKERLHVDHIARTHLDDVTPHFPTATQQSFINRPRRPRSIFERKTAALEGFPGHCWLEEKMIFRLRDKAEHRGERPGEHPRLAPREVVQRCDPAWKA